jgi:hypothetical protein
MAPRLPLLVTRQIANMKAVTTSIFVFTCRKSCCRKCGREKACLLLKSQLSSRRHPFISLILSRGSDKKTNNNNNNNNRKKTSRNHTSPTKSPPKKRSRRGPAILPEEEDDDDDSGGIIRNPSPSTLQMGLQVATALLKVPEQREFPSWSVEAQEALLDAVMTAFYTCAAFDFDKQQQQLQQSLIHQANKSLQQCLVHAQTAPQRHEISVVILRALLPVLNFKQLVPNGDHNTITP